MYEKTIVVMVFKFNIDFAVTSRHRYIKHISTQEYCILAIYSSYCTGLRYTKSLKCTIMIIETYTGVAI